MKSIEYFVLVCPRVARVVEYSNPSLRSGQAFGRRPVIRDNVNYRRHRNACKYYREDWDAPNVLYRCICLLDMPPMTREEQELCLKSRRGCWRFANTIETAAVLVSAD
ncbi:MAG: hypothetical protein HYY04_15145 [Chloroflexi bacterium]|nr:hypothetical protein [Chloroflexota bacterium]